MPRWTQHKHCRLNTRLELSYPHGPLHCIAWAPTSKLLAYGDEKGRVTIHNGIDQQSQSPQLQQGTNNLVEAVAWSPTGSLIAIACSYQIKIFSLQTGKLKHAFTTNDSWVFAIDWSPNGMFLASGHGAHEIRIWDTSNWQLLKCLRGHTGAVNAVRWSSDGNLLGSASQDTTARIWSMDETAELNILRGHSRSVHCMEWVPDSQIIVTGSEDNTLRIWSAETGYLQRIVQGHTNSIRSLAFSPNGKILASKSDDTSIRLWRNDTWQQVAKLPSSTNETRSQSLSFHPTKPLLASIGPAAMRLDIWHIDQTQLSTHTGRASTSYYSNAKVILVGEHSTGKTCLSRALIGKEFAPQESTHGMKVLTYKKETIRDLKNRTITREIMIWDLAGQTDYQVVHQLFLDQTSLALVVFDPANPRDPFYGIGHWRSALQRHIGEECPKALIAGRVDRGAPCATSEELEIYRKENGFEFYVSTSAKTGEGIADLQNILEAQIPWDTLPLTSSPALWKRIREFLISLRTSDDMIRRFKDVIILFRHQHPKTRFTEMEFETVFNHAQTQGLVWRLSFGGFVLLKPEILNDYASAIVRVARKHKRGLGSVTERDVLDCRIEFEDLERIPDTQTERILCHSVVEMFLSRELAIREGSQLVFPSKYNRKRPEFPVLPKRLVSYGFAGTIEAIYATLVVRLFYSGAYRLKELWKNAAEFLDQIDNRCGFVLENSEDGVGRISVFFDSDSSIDSKVLFLRFIHEHLQKRSLDHSVVRDRIYRCPGCDEEVDNIKAIQARLKNGKETIVCQYCDTQIQLIDLIEEKFVDPAFLKRVNELEKKIISKKEEEVGVATSRAKSDIGQFDIFLAHHSNDDASVEVLGRRLKQRGINPWIDEEQVPPGQWFQDVIQEVIPKVRCAGIVIGREGLGRWQTVELRAFISNCVESNVPVIPILLPGVKALPNELKFLRELRLVKVSDMLKDDGALDSIEWGILGRKPSESKKINSNT